MTDTSDYTPPEVWVWEKGDSPNWRYSNTNRPVAGATHEKALPPGAARHDFGCDAAIYLKRPGAGTRVRSWTPTA